MQSINEEDEVDYVRLAFVASQPPWSPPPRIFLKKMVLSNPKSLWAGEWSPVASAYITAIMLLLTVSLSRCLPPKHPPTPPPSTALTILRAGLAAWCLAVLYVHIVRRGKHWTLTMFTLWTWTLLGLRSCALALAAVAPAPLSGALAFCGDSVRFAVLCQAGVTVGVWWGVCVPIGWCMMDAEGFRRFMAVNLRSFVWLNLHGLVLPFALAEWWATRGPHALWELWVQVALAAAYLIVYLFFADPKLWQWYPFLSPRTHWCGVVYTLLLGAMIGIFFLLNEHAIPAPPPQ